MIRHYVVGGQPGQAAIESAGASNEVEYYEGKLKTIMGWSGLSINEAEQVINAAPDTMENADKPNFKPLYLEALANIRAEQQASK